MQPASRADQLRELAEAARRRCDLSTAQALYEEAVGLLRQAPLDFKFAHTIRHLGDIHTEQQDWSHAEPCYMESLAIYRGHTAPPALDLANAIRAYAFMKTQAGRADEARALWAEAGALYEAEGVTAGVEECREHGFLEC